MNSEAVKYRAVRDHQRDLCLSIDQLVQLPHDEVFVALGRRIEVERELAIECFPRHCLNVQNADRLLRELFHSLLLELRRRLDDGRGARLDRTESLDLMEHECDRYGDWMR